jgi:CotH protein
MKNILLIVLFLISFTALGFLLERSDYFGITRDRLQKMTLPSPPLKLGKRGTLLEKMGLRYVFPNDYSQLYDPKTGQFNFENIVSLASSRSGYHSNWIDHRRIPPEDYPSSTALDPSIIASGLPILSVVVAEKDLNDPDTGIIANSKRKGKAWERPCFISYYNQGRIEFASGAGIRVHGWCKDNRPSQNLRFYFRKAYGYDQFKPDLIFGKGSVPIKQIIARIEDHYVNLFGLDLARKIGCITPDIHPVLVYLNGKRYGHRYVLIEHLDEDWLRSHYGHDDFVLLRTTGHSKMRRQSLEYQRLMRWVNNQDIRMTMDEVNQHVDIDNLSLWFISQFFTAGNDMYQGPLLRDRTSPDARWFWVNWDMDHSFLNHNEPVDIKPWEQELNFHNVIRNPKRDRKDPRTARFQNKDPRAILFRRMHQEDPAFKKYFERLFMEVMNHKLSPEYLRAWVDDHQRAITPLDTDDQAFFDQLRLYVKHRPAYLRELMRKYFGSSESYSCRIVGQGDRQYHIDGYPHTPPYQGWYFKDHEISVRVDPVPGAQVAHWLVNGQVLAKNTQQLSYRVDKPTVIEPVFIKPSPQE